MGVSTLDIGPLGPQGDGIHLGTRGPVYVERALPGDRVRASLRREEGIARAEIVEILKPSPYRQKAPCRHYDQCGSCTLQHATPSFYRDWKRERVREAFLKQGLRPKRWLDTVFTGRQNRRRATFSACKQHGKIVMGY